MEDGPAVQSDVQLYHRAIAARLHFESSTQPETTKTNINHVMWR